MNGGASDALGSELSSPLLDSFWLDVTQSYLSEGGLDVSSPSVLIRAASPFGKVAHM